MAVPLAPIQVLAVTGSASGASVVFHNERASTLLAGGTSLANKLSAKFQTTSPLFQHQSKLTSFFMSYSKEFVVHSFYNISAVRLSFYVRFH